MVDVGCLIFDVKKGKLKTRATTNVTNTTNPGGIQMVFYKNFSSKGTSLAGRFPACLFVVFV